MMDTKEKEKKKINCPDLFFLLVNYISELIIKGLFLAMNGWKLMIISVTWMNH